MDQLTSPNAIDLQPNKTMWVEIKLKDKHNTSAFDLEQLAQEWKSPIKKIIIQKVFGENNKLRVGLVINSPDVQLEEPTSNEKHTKNRG